MTQETKDAYDREIADILIEEEKERRHERRGMLRWKLWIEPVAKGRPKFSKQGFAYTPAKTRKAEDHIIVLLMSQHEPLSPLPVGAIKINLIFCRSRPKSAPKKKPCEWTTRPDVDNLIKTVLDSMQGRYFRDDSQVTECHVWKRTAEINEPPYILIEVEAINE